VIRIDMISCSEILGAFSYHRFLGLCGGRSSVVKGREAKLAALLFVVGRFGVLDIAEHPLSQLNFAGLTCGRTLEDIEGRIGGQLHLFRCSEYPCFSFDGCPRQGGRSAGTSIRSMCQCPPSHFIQGSSQQTSMSMTTFSELGHLLFIFDFVRTRPYSFQADLDDVTIL
jgi:hypothetical protein